ncbi:MAG: polysaccharide biosynthesis C-terminal domain-containing protein [Candidatus Krumholzibacteriota bacterium]|nr:polysaccharide biosynthesis C-terminal domain-containing protein [Candidatus Krumholzibacteriota bacterium]
MASLSGKLIKGSFLRVLNPVSNIIVSFFMLPFVIGSIGDRWYGLWVLAAAFVGYYGLLDLGLSTANQRFISRAIGRGENKEVNIVFNTSLGLLSAGALLAILGSLIVIVFTPHFVENANDIHIFRIITIIIGFSMAISFPVRAFDGFLYSHIRYDVVNIIELVKLIVRTALIVYFLSHGKGIITLALISFLVETSQSIVKVSYVIKKHPELKIGISYFKRDQIKTLLGYSIYSFISTIGNRLQFHLDAFVITAFAGLSLVTHYNIGTRIAGYYILIITSMIALMVPIFSKLEGQNNYSQIRKYYIFMTKLNTILSVFIAGSLLIYGKAFIIRWMGPEYTDSFKVLAILLIGLLFNTIQISSKSILFAISKHKIYSIAIIIEGAANVLLSIILVRKFGILGVAMGTTIPALINNLFIIPAYTSRVINIKLARYTKIVAAIVLLGGAIHFGSWLLVNDFILNSYSRLFILSTATSIVFLILNAFIVLSREERKYFKIGF